MPTRRYAVTAVPLPPESRIANMYAVTHLADAYAIELPAGASTDPEALARFIFSRRSAWMSGLMAVRDAIVAGFGLKTAKGFRETGVANNENRIGIFKIYEIRPTEIVLGEDDKHLDFRLSLLCSEIPSTSDGRCLTVSTVVHCHNRLGRAYILVIAPFHRAIVRASIRRAARTGWPAQTRLRPSL